MIKYNQTRGVDQTNYNENLTKRTFERERERGYHTHEVLKNVTSRDLITKPGLIFIAQKMSEYSSSEVADIYVERVKQHAKREEERRLEQVGSKRGDFSDVVEESEDLGFDGAESLITSQDIQVECDSSLLKEHGTSRGRFICQIPQSRQGELQHDVWLCLSRP